MQYALPHAGHRLIDLNKSDKWVGAGQGYAESQQKEGYKVAKSVLKK